MLSGVIFYISVLVRPEKWSLISGKKAKYVDPVDIKGEVFQRVDLYIIYLGVIIDSRLNWNANTDHVIKKSQSRLYSLRKLHSFDASEKTLNMFYTHVCIHVHCTFCRQCPLLGLCLLG